MRPLPEVDQVKVEELPEVIVVGEAVKVRGGNTGAVTFTVAD